MFIYLAHSIIQLHGVNLLNHCAHHWHWVPRHGVPIPYRAA